MAELDAKTRNLLDHYNKGLSLFRSRKWEESIAEFRKALESVPEDGPSMLYISRCEEYIKNPPPEDWDGVYTATSK